MKKVLQIVGLSLVMGLATNGVMAHGGHKSVDVCCDVPAGYEQLSNTDQPVVIFKSPKGWKYPIMIKVDPRTSQWDIALLGTFDEKYQENRLASKPQDLENMVVLRNTINYLDGCFLKIDKQYQGSREAYGAILLEKMFKLVGLMSSEPYKGLVLADEYVEGLPMKWVLSCASDVTAISAYFKKQGVMPADEKPLLLLELLGTKKALSDADQAFLDTYFTLVDGKEPVVKAFFDHAQDYLSEATHNSGHAKNICETAGEAFFRTVVDEGYSKGGAEGLEAKKLMGVLVALSAVAASKMAWSLAEETKVWQDAKSMLGGLIFTQPTAAAKGKAEVNDTVKIVAGAAGVAVASFILYKIVSDIKKAYDASGDLEAAVESELVANPAVTTTI